MIEPKIVRRSVPSDTKLPSHLHPILQRVLAARGIQNISEIDTSLDGLFRTESLGGIDAATELLEKIIREQKKIVVVADFDCDGATSCAVALRALRSMGAPDVDFIVPNRFEYGYGLTPPIVDLAAQLSPDLLLTVDNGISSIEGVECSRRQNIDVLITDHHLPGAVLPNANAIVNPNVPGDEFPSKALAGVGVIFYVMLALRKRLADRGWFEQHSIEYPNLAKLLDFVALGTVADVVPLDQNNRRLVAQGLARIRAGKSHAGIRALLKVAGRDTAKLTSLDLGFAIGPRLNAAGRLADMSLGIACLVSDNQDECDRLAVELDDLNRERREIEAEMKTRAVTLVDEMELDDGAELRSGICLVDEDWHQGVVGIIASRIKERYHRPVIAFAPADDRHLKGSGRSIPEVHLRDALDAIAARHPGLLTRFGGHAMAAGLTLDIDQFDAFSDAFDVEIRRQIGDRGIDQIIATDGALAAGDFSLDLAQLLATAVPWGQSFPEPLFDGVFKIVEKRTVGETHVRLTLQPTDATLVIPAIAFGAVDELWAKESDAIHAVYRLAVNDYRNKRSLQLMISHAQPADD
jgi:single-stranded-DNA-specific exonuclease